MLEKNQNSSSQNANSTNFDAIETKKGHICNFLKGKKINFNANIIYAFKITNEIGTYLFCLESDLRKQKCDLFHFSTR